MADSKSEPTRPELPAELGDVEDGALAELLTKFTDEFDAMLDAGSRDVPMMTALADDIDRIKGETTARQEAERQADEEVAALAERVKGAKDPEPTEPEVTEPEVTEPEATVPEATVPEVTEPEPAKAPDKELVTAAARPAARPALGDVARRVPRPRVEPKRTGVSITASADLHGLTSGAPLDLMQVAQAMHDRARTLANDGRRAPVARITVPHTHVLGTDPMENVGIIDDLIGQPEAAALVASGGWCAPSVPIFDLFDIGPDIDNLFDLPGLGTKVRSGVMIPSFYGIGDVTNALWTWTEADDIAAAGNTGVAGDTVKPCMKIPCPTFTECVMEAEGLCVTHGNLSDRAWPELTKQFLSIVMGAHQRRLSAAKIAKVLADSVAPVTAGATMTPSDAAGDLLNVIALAAADMRSQFRVSKRRSVDVLLPDWTLEVLRNNMAMRHGVSDSMAVSDAQITSWLTSRGARVQFTPDWQPLHGGSAATTWPATVTFAIWFTGSYVSIDGGEIDLGVVRDSGLNATNDFTAAWSEQFYQVCRRGPQGRQYQVALSADGITGCCPVGP